MAIFALVAWSVQQLLSKVALKPLSTAKFYLLSAAVSLFVYAPYLVVRQYELMEGWMVLAIVSLLLQGLGAFMAKLIVTPAPRPFC